MDDQFYNYSKTELTDRTIKNYQVNRPCKVIYEHYMNTIWTLNSQLTVNHDHYLTVDMKNLHFVKSLYF